MNNYVPSPMTFENRVSIRNVIEIYIREILLKGWITGSTSRHVNTTGKFVSGGPDRDAGLISHKIIMDTQSGSASHGWSVLSFINKKKINCSSGFSKGLSIQLSSVISVAGSLPVRFSTVGSEVVEAAIKDPNPHGFQAYRGLNKPIYKRTAAYHHFSRTSEDNGEFSWKKQALHLASKMHLNILQGSISINVVLLCL